MADEIRKKAHGTTAEHAAYNGEAHQITVDTDKKTVVYQDGTTNGGFPLANESLPNRVPTRDIMAGAYLIGDKYVSAQRSAYVGTNGREFVLRDNHQSWRGQNAGNFSSYISGTAIGNSAFGASGPSGVTPTGGATLRSRMPGELFSGISTGVGIRQTTGALLFLGDGAKGGFHLRFCVSFDNANITNTTNNSLFFGAKKVSAFVNADISTTIADIIGIGTSQSLLTNPNIIVMTGGGGSAANNAFVDTTLDVAQDDVLEIELLSLPFENRVLHWRVQKLNDPSQVATGTVTGSGNNMPASTDPLYIHGQRFYSGSQAYWTLHSMWWRNFEFCGVI